MSRGRVRFSSDEAELESPADGVRALGPVVFSLRFDGRERHYDLSDLPHPRLVRAFAQALVQLGGDDGTMRTWQGLRQYVRSVRVFIAFIAESIGDSADPVDLPNLSPELIDAFERNVLADYPPASSQPWEIMSAVVRLLRLINEARPGAFSAQLVGRISFALAASSGYVKTPVDAYTSATFAAIEQAALTSVRAVQDRILRGEREAQAGEDPTAAGWGKRENLLWHTAHHGPLTRRDAEVIGLGRRELHELNSQLYLTVHDLVPFLVLIICRTGMEPECVKGLRADCLVNPARGFVSVEYVKRRSPGSSHKTLRIADGGALHHPGGIVRLAQRLTRRGRELLGSDALWVDVWYDGLHESFATRRGLDAHISRWMSDQRLQMRRDRDGTPLRLDLRRLRKSFKSERYRQAAGVLPDFATGHSIDTAAEHYGDIETHRELHETAVESGLREALQTALAPPVVVDGEGRRLNDGAEDLPAEEVRAVLSEQNDVWLASCRNFFDSPFARRKGAACPVAAWACLECANAVFTTRHLPSVLSFLAFVDGQREAMPAVQWQARFGLARQRIAAGILPRFSDDQVATALAIAEASEPGISVPALLLQDLM